MSPHTIFGFSLPLESPQGWKSWEEPADWTGVISWQVQDPHPRWYWGFCPDTLPSLVTGLGWRPHGDPIPAQPPCTWGPESTPTAPRTPHLAGGPKSSQGPSVGPEGSRTWRSCPVPSSSPLLPDQTSWMNRCQRLEQVQLAAQ